MNKEQLAKVIKKNQAFFNSLPFSLENDPVIMGMYRGYHLAAPVSFWDADQELRDAIASGCGPGGLGDYVVPDTIYLLNVKPACKIHDWTFCVWNCKVGFKLSNNLFKNNMVRIINQHGGNNNIQCLRRKRSLKYYKGVHYFGEPSYYDNHLKYVV